MTTKNYLCEIPCCFPLKPDYSHYPIIQRLLFTFLSQMYSYGAMVTVILKMLFSPLINARRNQKIVRKIVLRKPNEKPYFIKFCATKGYIHGHAFTIWKEGENENFVGFYPKSKQDGYRSVFIKTTGTIRYGEDIKYANNILYSLEVEINRETYEYAKSVTRLWENTYYIGAKRDCLTYLYSLAQAIGLKNPRRGFFYLYTIPETYLPKLIEINCNKSKFV